MSVSICPFQNIVCLLLVNDFSGSKEGNFEPLWSDLKLNYDSISSDGLTKRGVRCKKSEGGHYFLSQKKVAKPGFDV